MLKRGVVWFLALTSVLGVAVGYWGIYVLAAYFAAGLVWWASLALFISGPIGASAVIVGRKNPKQRTAIGVGLVALASWLLLWGFLLVAIIRSAI